MNKKQRDNLEACYKQIENDLPILFTIFSKVGKQTATHLGHIVCKSRITGKFVSVQYSLQLQKNDGKTRVSNIHMQKGEFFCFWVSHRYPLKNVDYYCLVCPDEPNIRIFVKKDELKTGMNYFKFHKEVIFSDGIKIWDYAGLRDEYIKHNDIEIKCGIKEFHNEKWKEEKWIRKTSQSLWLIKAYKGTPQEYYTKISLAQIYRDNKHWNYIYKNQRTASITINKKSKNNKWTMIAFGSTNDVEYWAVKGDLNADHKLLLDSFVDN